MVGAAPHRRSSITATAFTVTAIACAGLFLCLNLDCVGQWFVQQDNLLEATYCYQLMTAVDSLLGVRDFRLSSAWNTLSNCYAKLGRNVDAIYAGRQARNLMCSLTGQDSVNVCLLDAELGQSLARSKDFSEAERLLCSSLSQLKRMKPAAPFAQAYVLSILIDTYIGEKKYAQAEANALELVPLDDLLQQHAELSTFGPRQKLVEIYCQTNRLAQAQQVAAQAVVQSEQAANPLTKAAAHDSLGRVYLLLGKIDQARQEFDRSLAFVIKRYGANDHRVAYWRARYQQLLVDKKPFTD